MDFGKALPNRLDKLVISRNNTTNIQWDATCLTERYLAMPNAKIRVLFVCTGNICRSPMAEAVFAQLVAEAGLADRFELASAGTGDWHIGEAPHRGTLDALRRHNVPLLPGRRAQAVNPALLTQADYIIALDEGHVEDLRAFARYADGKVARLLDYAPDVSMRDMPDPYYSGKFEEVYQLTVAGARGLLAHIREQGL